MELNNHKNFFSNSSIKKIDFQKIQKHGIQAIQLILETEEEVDCIIVAAGMEGALATLVSTMVDIPIIGIPTSAGYGYGGKGIAALASMLQSCSLGLSVVNIDNGIAAGGIAANIANRAVRKK